MSELHAYRKAHPHSKLLTIQGLFFLAFVVFLFLLTGVLTNANPAAVLLGFAPSIIFAIILIILVETDHFHPSYNWLILVTLLVIATVLFIAAPFSITQNLDAGTLIILNAALMIIALVIIHSSYTHEKPVPEPLAIHREAPKIEQHLHITHLEVPKDVTAIIHSLEDKIKALNFVIGRVYSVYHGGTDHLRNKLRIDKDWYNDFNQIPEKDIEKRKHEAIVLLEKIKARLDVLEKSEHEVFGTEVEKIKNIVHDKAGKEKIIAVLVRNDKDPVRQYYDGANRVCEEALKTLKH